MVEEEISFYKNVYSIGCPGCNRIEPQPKGLDIVLETDSFRVHQDYALPIPGMMVMELKRHVNCITEFTVEELNEFVTVLMKTRKAIKNAGILDATLVLEEKSPHFHAWWLPIHPWMKDVTDGKIRNMQFIFNHAKKNMVTESNIKKVEEIVSRIKIFLTH